MTEPRTRSLHDLCADAGIAYGDAPDVVIRDVVTDSRSVRDGSLFIAIPGTQVDGREFIDQAIAAGAAAIVTEQSGSASEDVVGAVAGAAADSLSRDSASNAARSRAQDAVPILMVENARIAVAHFAAAWYGHPAKRLRLLGITGTVGKTSVLTIAETLLHASGARVASIGSLGLRIDGETVEESSYTVPEPLLLHRWLAHAADAGCELVVMEVTSHALAQQRVAGLLFAAGAFTNLVPLEHAEFHGNFRNYVAAKSKFFDHLAPAAPLAFNADDRAVSRLVRERSLRSIGCGAVRTASVRIEDVRVSAEGTEFVLNARRPIPRTNARDHVPFSLPLELSLLGRSNLLNVSLGAALALSAGANVSAAGQVLPQLEAPRRRMQLLRTEPFLILDDTVGHPDSVSVVFETAGQLEPRRVHVVWAVRGRRGPRINRYNAEALAIWSRKVPLESLAITRSTDVADGLNRVSGEEYDAFLRPLRRAGVQFVECSELRSAIRKVLGRADGGDLVLLLGAQGMNEGAAIAEEWLRAPVHDT